MGEDPEVHQGGRGGRPAPWSRCPHPQGRKPSARGLHSRSSRRILGLETGGIEPTFMSPAKLHIPSLGRFRHRRAANNRGMVVGAFIIVLMEFVFNVLVAGQGSSDLPLHSVADRIDGLLSGS